MQNWDDQIQEIEKKIGYVFKDKSLIRQAFTHRSFSNEQLINNLQSYERIEFLGDAVLDVITSEYLMDMYPMMDEGDLTKARAQAVCETALAHCAKELELGNYVLLGKGEAKTGGQNRISIVADVMEALIGSIYRDGGLEYARDFVHRRVLSKLPKGESYNDNKSAIQEYVMKHALGKLRYELAGSSGPEHDKIFHIELYLQDKVLSTGSGKSKKAAEQDAALDGLQLIYPGFKNK